MIMPCVAMHGADQNTGIRWVGIEFQNLSVGQTSAETFIHASIIIMSLKCAVRMGL